MGFEKLKPTSFVKYECFPDSEEVTAHKFHKLSSLSWLLRLHSQTFPMDKILYESLVLVPLLAYTKALVPCTEPPKLSQAKVLAAELW